MIRLDKYLSDLKLASRKELKTIIKTGRVSVNGKTVTVSDCPVEEGKDEVALDGRPLSYSRFRYFAMDKPAGILTASEDRTQKTVMDLLPREVRAFGLFPVGRLDKDTTGLLLLTNDGDYAHRVISPRHAIDKRYCAETAGTPTDADIRAFAGGITLRDGLRCLPAVLEVTGENRCEVVVQEGKYHQVKRMLAAVGKPVVTLRRLSIGALELKNLEMQNSFCELSQEAADLVFMK